MLHFTTNHHLFTIYPSCEYTVTVTVTWASQPDTKTEHTQSHTQCRERKTTGQRAIKLTVLRSSILPSTIPHHTVHSETNDMSFAVQYCIITNTVIVTSPQALSSVQYIYFKRKYVYIYMRVCIQVSLQSAVCVQTFDWHSTSLNSLSYKTSDVSCTPAIAANSSSTTSEQHTSKQHSHYETTSTTTVFSFYWF